MFNNFNPKTIDKEDLLNRLKKIIDLVESDDCHYFRGWFEGRPRDPAGGYEVMLAWDEGDRIYTYADLKKDDE